MKNKLLVFIKLVLLAFFSFIWFVLIQAEYEMITKPELQNEFPIIKGVYAVYFLGFILLVISLIIVSLLLYNLTTPGYVKNIFGQKKRSPVRTYPRKTPYQKVNGSLV
jgi:hypothetical protein